MNGINKNIFLTVGLALAVLMSAACSGRKTKADGNHLKVGVESGPEYVVAETAQKVAKEKYGLEVELVQFNDYIMPNTALDNGDIDANAFQHQPYLEEQSKERGYRFAIVGKTFIYPLAAYSKKIKSLSELKAGSTIAIPNDITNGGRALLLMQKAGLIRLSPNAGITPKVTDILENKKNLKIVELEAPQLPRVLDDKSVTVAIINNTFAAGAGLSVRSSLFVEDKNSPYANVIAVREENKNSPAVEKFVKAYHSDEVVKTAERVFKGGAVKAW